MRSVAMAVDQALLQFIEAATLGSREVFAKQANRAAMSLS